MIVGLGTDIVEVRRIAKMIADHGDHFIQRTFTAAEIAHCGHRREPGLSDRSVSLRHRRVSSQQRSSAEYLLRDLPGAGECPQAAGFPRTHRPAGRKGGEEVVGDHDGDGGGHHRVVDRATDADGAALHRYLRRLLRLRKRHGVFRRDRFFTGRALTPSGPRDIVWLNADGSDIHTIATNIGRDNEPAMLPDGRIAFSRLEVFYSRNKTELTLHAVHADGTMDAWRDPHGRVRSELAKLGRPVGVR